MEIIKYDNNILLKFYAKNGLEFDEAKGYFGKDIKSFALKEYDKVIGAVSISTYKNKKFIEAIAVDKEYRNNGYGKLLVNKAIEELGTPVYLISKTHDFFKNIGFINSDEDLIDKECISCNKYNVTCFPKVLIFK